MKVAITPLALREVVERPEVDALRVLLHERRAATAKPSAGTVTTPPITRAEAERRALEEDRCAGSVSSLVGRRRGAARARRRPARRLGAGARLRLELDRPRVAARRRRAPRANAKTTAIARADGDDDPADDEADEDAGDADREAERPEARARDVRLVVGRDSVSTRVNRRSTGTRMRQRRTLTRLATRARAAGSSGDAVLGPAAVDERPDLGAHLDLLRPLARALLGPLVRRVDPELAAEELDASARGRAGRAAPR